MRKTDLDPPAADGAVPLCVPIVAHFHPTASGSWIPCVLGHRKGLNGILRGLGPGLSLAGAKSKQTETQLELKVERAVPLHYSSSSASGSKH